METIEELKRRIQSTEDLQSVVKTMKSLAAVKIRQFQQAVASLEDFNDTIKMALRIVLRSGPGLFIRERDSAEKDRIGCVVFGSDQGMCGSLNDQVVGHAMAHLEELETEPGKRVVLAVGERARSRLEERGQPVEATMAVPGGVEGITPRVRDLLQKILAWQERGVDRVILFHSEPLSGASYRPRTVGLLPLDRAWIQRLQETPWPTRALPFFRDDPQALFSGLVREYLFAGLFRAFAQSLASENASRLASMQGAEKNIEEQLTELQNRFHQQRQMSITEELLDIVAGFEALQEES